MKETYIPSPIDTSDVVLDETIIRLTELLSKNTHEVWSAGRISQGWSYGPERNDEEKKHPCLIPYEELSEEEKSYDRNTALETLKCIISLGYTIVPPEEK